jgi:hypothetical protein
MKDARQGLHSLIEIQGCLHNLVDLLELNEHSPAQVQTFHSSTTAQSHGDIYKLSFKTSLLRNDSGGHFEGLALLQHRPTHTRILGRNGHYGFPVPPALLHTDSPAAYRVGLVLGC